MEHVLIPSASHVLVFFYLVLVGVSIAVIKPWDQKSWGEKGLFDLHLLSPLREAKSGIETRWEPGVGADALGGMRLASHVFLSLLFYRTRAANPIPSKAGWGLPHQSLIKKIFSRLAYSPIGRRHFLHWGSYLSNNPSLCQIDIKLSHPSYVQSFTFCLVSLTNLALWLPILCFP